MKLKLYSCAALVTIAALTSCAGNDNKDYVDKSIIPAASEKAAAPNAAPNATIPGANAMPVNNPMPANLQPQANTVTVPGAKPVMVTNPQAQQIIQSQPNNVVMTPVQTPVQSTAPGMNPPHGQPNHRCDIAVGAPLNSKPVPAQTQATTAAQPQVTMKQIPNTQKTLPGMNPPHGEPGHRCDIAVGAPLNSKPAATPTTVIAAPPPLLAAPKTDSSKN